MANVFEAAVDVVESLFDDEPKDPLHVGEVMCCWLYLGGLEEAKVFVEAALNTTADTELKDILEEDQKLGKAQRHRLRKLMLNEGITLPPAPESKPAQSIRNDVQLLFAQFQAEEMILGTKVKTMMRRRGWIKVPPYYYPPGAPQNMKV